MEKSSENMDPLSLAVSAVSSEDKSGIISKIYTDLAQPGVQKVGKALGTVLDLSNVLATPFWMLNEYVGVKKEVFKRNMEALKVKIDEIPEEKVCEVPPEIGVPIIDVLTYLTNEQLRNAYINLLSKASSEDTASLAHPAFANIISRLSSDEAKIIEYLKDKKSILFTSYQINLINEGFLPRKNYATGIEFYLNLNFPSNMEVYLNNLISLGIIDFTPGIRKIRNNAYDELLKLYEEYEAELQKEIDHFNDNLKKVKDLISSDDYNDDDKYLHKDFTHEEGFFDITPFGLLFIKACTN